jgi:hypothetical protein
MRRIVIRRCIAGALSAMAIATTIAVTSETASADPNGKYDGKWVSDLSSCSSYRTVRTTKIYGGNTVYGTASQRQGTSGACKNYQWVRITATRNMPLHYDRFFISYYDKSRPSHGGDRYIWVDSIPKGKSYNTQILFLPNSPECAYVSLGGPNSTQYYHFASPSGAPGWPSGCTY